MKNRTVSMASAYVEYTYDTPDLKMRVKHRPHSLHEYDQSEYGDEASMT